MNNLGKNLNPTVRHIWDMLRTSEGSLRCVPAGGTGRLGFNVLRRKLPATYKGLADHIDTNISQSTIFFPDTNFFTAHEVPSVFWDAILHKRVVIAPWIWQELQPWLNCPRWNASVARIVQAAAGASNSAVHLEHETPWDEGHFRGRTFYATLLSWRKQYSLNLVLEFMAENGRGPEKDEMNHLYQRFGLDRDFHLLRKGLEDRGKANYFADEDLVVSATMVGLFSGCNTVILTRDRDVLDQFEKLMGLLTEQYQSLLFAEQYAAAPDGFFTKPMPVGIPELKAYFHTEESLLVRKQVDNLDQFTAALLPENFRPVLLTCVLIGGLDSDMTMTPLSFEAEQDMDRLVCIKGRTRGRSTDRLGDRNCHVTGFPVGIEDPRRWVVVSRDKVAVPMGGEIYLPMLEMEHALLHKTIYSVMTSSEWDEKSRKA